MKQDVYLPSKPRYEILDGLRGVAAIMVICFHLFEVYSHGAASQIINHGYLAVDFFFVLSGFVAGYAYDDRWGKMSLGGFFKRRLTRLHPMVIAGTVIGAALFLFQGAAFPKIMECTWQKFVLCFVMGLFMIPCGHGLDIRGWGELNSFNGPNWTLTYEYVGNILYALIFRHLPKAMLAVLCACCAFFTLDLTLGWDVFNLFPVRQFIDAQGIAHSVGGPQFNVIGGWSLDPQQIYIGFTRLLYPFLCGLLISRILPSRMTSANPSGSPLRLKGGFWWCSLILVAILAIPCIGGKSGVADGLFQAAAILIVFPVVVLIGAGSRTTRAFSTRICKFLGDISYPIYITHYPLIYMQTAWVKGHPDAPLWMHVTVGAGVMVLAVIIAYGLLKIYDLPLREWLKVHWLKSSKTAAKVA